MAVHRKVIAALLLACTILLSGCGPGVHELQQQNEQQQQKITQLEAALAAAQAGAIQQDLVETALANEQLAYEWAGPLRWLPIWSNGINQQINHSPDWRGYLMITAIWSGLIFFVATLITISWIMVWTIERVTKKTWLEHKIKGLEQRAGPLLDMQKSLKNTQEEIRRLEWNRKIMQDELEELEKKKKIEQEDIAKLQTQVETLKADLESLRGFL